MVIETEAISRHREYHLTLGLKSLGFERAYDKSLRPVCKDIKMSGNQELLIRYGLEFERPQIERALDSDKKSFVARLPENIGKEEFLMKLGGESVPADREVLGSGSDEDFVEQMASAVLYPSVMAEYPVTFGSEAIAGIIDMVGSSRLDILMNPEKDLLHTDVVVDRTSHLTNRMLELGSIEVLEDRFMIPPRKKRKLTKILEKFDD